MSQCSVCDSAALGPLDHQPVHVDPYSEMRFTLHECPTCGIQVWEPRIHPTGDYYESEAMSLYSHMHAGREAVEDPRFLHVFDRIGPVTQERVLEIGCADGVVLDELKRQGNQVWGMDLDRKSVEVAHARGLENVTCEDTDTFVQRAENDGLTFSLILAFDVLEHLVDPRKTVSDLTSLLEPGGRLVATVPNRHRLLRNAVSSDFPPHHFFRFDGPGITNLLERAGLRVTDVHTFQYGYVHRMAIAALWARYTGRKGAAKTPTDTPQATAQPGRLRRLRRLVRLGLEASLRPGSIGIERALNRGFKVYAAAEKPMDADHLPQGHSGDGAE